MPVFTWGGAEELFVVFFGFQLLHNKANINAINEHGNTPLHYACFWGYDQIAEVSAFCSWMLPLYTFFF